MLGEFLKKSIDKCIKLLVSQMQCVFKYIEYCFSKGIVAGMGQGIFAPSASITGEQAAKMILVSLLGKNGFAYTGTNWAAYVSADANSNGLYSGLGSLNVTSPIDRESVAQMIWNAQNK